MDYEVHRGVLSSLHRFLPFLKPHRHLLGGAALLLVVGLALDLVAPLLLKELIDGPLREGDLHRLNLLIGVFVLIYGFRFLANLGGSSLRNRFNENVFRDLRKHLYEHIQTLSHSFFNHQRSGYLTSRIFSDVNQLGGMLGGMFLGGLTSTVLLLGALGITLSLNWRLTLVVLLVVPVLAILTKVFNRRIRAATHAMQEQISQLCGGMQENLAGMSLIQSYTLEGFATRRVGEDMEELRRVNLRLLDLKLLHRTGMALMTSIAGLAILWVGSRELVRGNLTIGALMAFLAYAVYVYRPVQELLGINLSVHGAAAAAGRIFDLLDTRSEVEDEPDAVALCRPVRGEVRYEHVRFGYGEGSDDVLHDVSFHVNPGAKVAIVGRSGAGKTTLLHLLPRFYDRRAGRIEIDGQDIRSLTRSSLRGAIGMVSQETFLFSGSIRDNLLCIRTEASEAQLLEALEAAHLSDFLARLPRGLDSEVGEQGVRVSGGERQRLSIARAFLKDPAILILDEATSSVDSISENQIRTAIDRLMTGRTCFLIAHRFATILDADQILVLEKGRLVGQGTHEELYAGNPSYTRLYDEQFEATGPLPPTSLPLPEDGDTAPRTVHVDGKRFRAIVRNLEGGQKRLELGPDQGPGG